MKPFTLKKLPPLKPVTLVKPIKKSTSKKEKTCPSPKTTRSVQSVAIQPTVPETKKKSVPIPVSKNTTVTDKNTPLRPDYRKMNREAKKADVQSVVVPVTNPVSVVPDSITPPKWTIPDGIVIAAALSFFVREWKAGNKDAIRLLALQSEAYGVNIPMSLEAEQLDSLIAEIFRIVTKGKELTKTCEPIRKLLSWPGFAGGMI